MFGALQKARKRNHRGQLVNVKKSKAVGTEALQNRTEKSPLNITDLSDECLMYILCLLHLDALSVVAQVNIRFKQLVYDLLDEKCEAGKVSVSTSNRRQWLWIDDTPGKFVFKDLSDLQKFFHKTGVLITSLSISCSSLSHLHTYQKVEKSILELCSETLTSIVIDSNLLPIFSEITKVFHNVDELEFNGCELSENLSQRFDEYFPSVQRLTLINCKTRNPECIETHFECLEDLTVVGKRKNRMVFKKNNIKEALRQNPQIRRLVVDFNSTNDRELDSTHPDYDLDAEFYRFVNEALPKLEELSVFGERKHHSDQTEEEIEFWRMKKLSVHYIYSQEPNEIAPFTFNRLRVLKLKQMTTLSKEWVNFIIRNDGLEKLTIDINCNYEEKNGEESISCSQIQKEQLLKIVKWLTKLKQLRVTAAAVDAKDIMAILPKRKSLMIICLRDYCDVDSIVDTFDKLTAKKKWLVDYNAKDLILKRFGI